MPGKNDPHFGAESVCPARGEFLKSFRMACFFYVNPVEYFHRNRERSGHAAVNKESLNEYVLRSQQGDMAALEELLLYAYGIVDYQCKKLLPTAQAADKMTGIVLKTVVSKLDTLGNSEDFFSWLGKITCVRCMRVRATLLENGQGEQDAAPKSFSFPGMELNKAETAQVAEMLSDMLPQEQRLSLYLYSLGGLTPRGISGLTGVPEETVQQHIQSAQQAVLRQMKRYAEQGVTFTQANSLPALLRTCMLLNPAPEKAQMVVYSLLPARDMPPRRRPEPEIPSYPEQKQRSDKGLIRFLAAIVAILSIVLIISLGILFSRLNKKEASLMLPPAQSTSQEFSTSGVLW